MVTLPLKGGMDPEKPGRILGAIQIEISGKAGRIGSLDTIGNLRENELEVIEYISDCLKIALSKQQSFVGDFSSI